MKKEEDFYKNFILFTKELFNKHGTKLQINKSINRENIEYSIGIDSHYWNKESNTHQISEMLEQLEKSITNDKQLVNIKINTHTIVTMIKSWFNNTIKLSPSNIEFENIYNHVFSNIETTDLLNYIQPVNEYVKPSNKKYAKELVRVMKINPYMIYPENAIKEILQSYNQFKFNKEEYQEYFNLLLDKYSDLPLQSIKNMEFFIFEEIKKNFSKNEWKNYIHFLPTKSQYVLPKENEVKNTLFINKDLFKDIIKVDNNYIMQKYHSVIDLFDTQHMIRTIAEVIQTKKDLFLLSECELVVNKDNSVFLLTAIDNNPIDITQLFFVIEKLIELYSENKTLESSPQSNYLEKACDFIILNKNVTEKTTGKTKKIKI